MQCYGQQRDRDFDVKITFNVLMLAIQFLASPMNCLVKLPQSFVELHGIVNRVKAREGRPDDSADDSGFETAICLLTGTVMRSGATRRMKKVSSM